MIEIQKSTLDQIRWVDIWKFQEIRRLNQFRNPGFRTDWLTEMSHELIFWGGLIPIRVGGEGVGSAKGGSD